MVQKEKPRIGHEVRSKEEKSALTNDSVDVSLTPPVKPFVTVIPTPPPPQNPELVMSEPCTPRNPLEGWSISMPFSALAMREVDDIIALASPASSGKASALSITPKLPPLVLPSSSKEKTRQETETSSQRLSITKLPPLVLPSFAKDVTRQETETFSQKLSARRKIEANNARLFCRATSSDMAMRCFERIISKSIPAESGDTLVDEKFLPRTCCGAEAPRKSPTSCHLRRNDEDAGEHRSHKRRNGTTTCSMGVAVLRDREDYENRGQCKQSFSDVWKSAMDAERRYASERARLISDVKRRRLKQLQIEKEQKQAMLKERELTRQRVAVQTHLEMVENMKARREGAIKRNRVLEKRRY
ncbi:hypothetical protein R1flu_012395 [Riccia fluitans]|uniref:Remorin C-terminal domain-containing protein n=1 Tax=Riccia fluitans TaxID=41844 RepID=A0ABD1ZBM5_9MARC